MSSTNALMKKYTLHLNITYDFYSIFHARPFVLFINNSYFQVSFCLSLLNISQMTFIYFHEPNKYHGQFHFGFVFFSLTHCNNCNILIPLFERHSKDPMTLRQVVPFGQEIFCMHSSMSTKRLQLKAALILIANIMLVISVSSHIICVLDYQGLYRYTYQFPILTQRIMYF